VEVELDEDEEPLDEELPLLVLTIVGGAAPDLIEVELEEEDELFVDGGSSTILPHHGFKFL